jgi:hypothetical protein
MNKRRPIILSYTLAGKTLTDRQGTVTDLGQISAEKFHRVQRSLVRTVCQQRRRKRGRRKKEA